MSTVRRRVGVLSEVAKLISAVSALIDNVDERALLLLAARRALDSSVVDVRQELEATPEDLELRGYLRYAANSLQALDEALRGFERETETDLRERAMRALRGGVSSRICEQRSSLLDLTAACGSPVTHTFIWPGRSRSGICRAHVPKLLQVAESVGLSSAAIDLQEIP